MSSKGTWEYTVAGKPPATLKAGDVLFIPAGAIHSARNVGTGRAAELATCIVEKGKPLLTVVDEASMRYELFSEELRAASVALLIEGETSWRQ